MSRQYLSASNVVNAVLFEGRSLKSYCGDKNVRIGKVDYALACETIKFSTVITKLLQNAQTSANVDISNVGLVYVMLYEFLFGAGKVSGGGSVKRQLLEHLPQLKILLQQEMARTKAATYFDLLPEDIRMHSSLPQYARINEIKVSIHEGLEELRRSVSVPTLSVDKHIASLVQLPNNGKSLGEHPWSKDGRFILQDKASCFPSQILMDEWGRLEIHSDNNTKGDIIDACAAPGNKTSHMAAIANNYCKSIVTRTNPPKKMTIFAFDKSPRRASLLSDRMVQAGAQGIVETCTGDFLQVNVADVKYQHVTALLVDPSCSGSGVLRSLERCADVPFQSSFDIKQKTNNSSKPSDRDKGGQHQQQQQPESNQARLAQLQQFQVAAVRKAMQFPNARIVVYSTCSIHEEENEDVVKKVLESDEAIRNGWQLSAPHKMASDSWHRRGNAVQGLTGAQQTCLLRCLPEDGMNGFFVALFVRRIATSLPTTSTTTTTKSALVADPVAKTKIISSHSNSKPNDTAAPAATLMVPAAIKSSRPNTAYAVEEEKDDVLRCIALLKRARENGEDCASVDSDTDTDTDAENEHLTTKDNILSHRKRIKSRSVKHVTRWMWRPY